MLTLIRGLPGSGKSTLAKSLGVYHLEADMFMMKNGKYEFNPTRISGAHAWCTKRCWEALTTGIDVVVSNTFTQKWEIQPYIDMAIATDEPYRIIHCTSTFGSIHAVPDSAISAMLARWEVIEGEETK
jgi:predicted kinase